MYKVIKPFYDLQDGIDYKTGDTFPRKGKATQKRLAELSSKENKRGEPLIEKVALQKKE